MSYSTKTIQRHWIHTIQQHMLRHNRSKNRCISQSKLLVTSSAAGNKWNVNISYRSTCDSCQSTLYGREQSTKVANTSTNDRTDDGYVWLNICYSFDDVKNTPPAGHIDAIFSYYKYTMAKCTIPSIQEKACELFHTKKGIEYYDDQQQMWWPLTEMPNDTLKIYKTGTKVLHLRIPKFYDELEIGDVNDDIEENDRNDNNLDVNLGDDEEDESDTIPNKKDDLAKLRKMLNENTKRVFERKYSPEKSIERMIRLLVKKLQETGYVRSNIKMRILVGRSDEISTKQWVILESMGKDNSSQFLRSIILSNAGALDHIVQCLHYDFIWKKIN
jgi:hypothetical protein